MDIKEILSIQDIGEKIDKLKKGRNTPMPNTEKNLRDWEPSKHDIMDEDKHPKIRVTVREEREYYDETLKRTVIEPAKYELKDPNRIALPIEQDIVNVHTAFTVGTEPEMTCDVIGEEEEKLFTVLKKVTKKNRIKYKNKKIFRSWKSEQEVAEYWYLKDDDGFWDKVKRIVQDLFGKTKAEKRLASVIWSPFRGDSLYPYYDSYGDMVAFSRGYKKRDVNGKEIEAFMTIDDTSVYVWEQSDNGWIETSSFKHGFKKIPVVYTYSAETLSAKIRTLRARLEKVMSGYADCIDYHFFPILKIIGDLEGASGDTRNRVLKLIGGASAEYLTWNQSSAPVKEEVEKIIDQIYTLTNTPRLSFDNLKNAGNHTSGTAFRYMFMGAHMAVQNHAEDLGEFLQRRVNFLVSAIGSICPRLEEASRTVDVEVEIQPFMIDDLAEKVNTAVSAVSGGVWSRREGIVFAGNVDRLDDELKEIEAEMSKSGQEAA